MANKKKASHDTNAGGISDQELLDEMQEGTLQLGRKPAPIAELLTKESVEKFLFGEITWAQLMGLSMEEAYNIAEYGYGLYEEARYHDARAVFEALVLANPYDAYFHNVLGAVYQQLDMQDEALEQYSIAIDLDPEAMHAFVNRGEMLLQNGQFEQALDDLNTAIKLDKSGADPAVLRARALATAAKTVLDGVQRLFGKDLAKAKEGKR